MHVSSQSPYAAIIPGRALIFLKFIVDDLVNNIPRVIPRSPQQLLIHNINGVQDKEGNGVLELSASGKIDGRFFKINVDVAVKKRGTGLGIIIRDSNGFVLRDRGMFKDRVVNSEWAELDAMIEGISFARSLNLNKVNFEMDCTSVVNRVRKARADITFFGHRIKEVQNISVPFSAFDIR
uniref:RNase H type-1 domain-containing protein n=1 Tax=Gossypium raimondii TaxID=29730 RepID=A0A0D2SHU8_GOSRA|nr:hypothetical protein B456_005G157700 [Gossypium raimondii]